MTPQRKLPSWRVPRRRWKWYLRRDRRLHDFVKKYEGTEAVPEIVRVGSVPVRVWRMEIEILDAILSAIGAVDRARARHELPLTAYQIYVDHGNGKLIKYGEQRLATLHSGLLAS